MRRQARFKTRMIKLPKRGLRIVVVADTHSKPHPEALGLIKKQKPDYILHGGDVGDLAVLDPLEAIAPLITVRGNIDSTGTGLPDVVTLKFETAGRIRSCWILTHIAVQGSKLRRPIREVALHDDAQLVVCGHSHIPLKVLDRGIGIFNPGSIGPRRFHLPITFGVITLSEGGLHLKHISCETGEEWLPVL